MATPATQSFMSHNNAILDVRGSYRLQKAFDYLVCLANEELSLLINISSTKLQSAPLKPYDLWSDLFLIKLRTHSWHLLQIAQVVFSIEAEPQIWN